MDIISPPVNHRKIDNQYSLHLMFNVHNSIDMFKVYDISQHVNMSCMMDTVKNNLIS